MTINEQIAVEWRKIAGFDNYQVSNDGRVRRRFSWKQYPALYQLKLKLNRDGYFCVTLSNAAGRRECRVNRLVALAFIGPQPSDRHVVAHNNGRKTDNSLRNLRWATYAENEADKLVHGAKPAYSRGNLHHGAVLTERIVKALRSEKWSSGTSYRALANKYGFKKLSVYDAVRGITWTHITEVPPYGRTYR